MFWKIKVVSIDSIPEQIFPVIIFRVIIFCDYKDIKNRIVTNMRFRGGHT